MEQANTSGNGSVLEACASSKCEHHVTRRETNDAVLAKMWHRDVSSFANLDFNRFCCSIFYFVEMWVQEITQEAYDRIFSIVRTILADQQFAAIPSSVDAPDSTFKPTLESFSDAFDRERHMESMNMNIGKSITFDAKKYFQHFGSPTAIIQASNPNFLTSQERSTRTTYLSSDRGKAYIRQYCHCEGGTVANATISGCSNPMLLRSASSRPSRLIAYSSNTSFSISRPGSPPPIVPRTDGPFMLAGTSLQPPEKVVCCSRTSHKKS